MAGEVISNRSIRLRDYRYQGELLSLVLTFLILSTLFALLTFFFPTNWSTTLKALTITFAGLGVYITTVKMQQRTALGTLVRVGPRQFPELDKLATKAAERLSYPPVPVYVKRSSEMNIYTLGFWQQPIIVLTSSLVDQMEPDNLQFFIGRELGHVQAGHTWLRTLLKPLGADVPIIGKLLNSVIFGDWMNRAELTADRAGFIACRSLTTAVSTMLKFGVGIRLFEKLDIKEFLDQIKDVRDVRGHLTEIVAEQPYLTQRVRALVKYALSPQFSAFAHEKQSNTKILQSLPDAFVSSGLNASDLVRILASDEPPRGGPETVLDEEAITIADHFDVDGIDENALDPNLLLIAVDSGASHALRRLYTRIGRNQDNDIVVNSDRVSRYHAEIVREDEDLKLVDKESRNGVWLNGKKINEAAVIKPGDLIRIGRQDFTFTVKDCPSGLNDDPSKRQS